MLLGLGTARFAYIANPRFRRRSATSSACCTASCSTNGIFDELYHLLLSAPAFAIGRFLWHRGDEKTIDRFGPTARLGRAEGSRAAGKLHHQDMSIPMRSSC